MRAGGFLFLSVLGFAQPSSTASGQCSPIAPNNSGSITINCPGLSKVQGVELLKIVNKILANQSDLKEFGGKLDAILKGVNQIKEETAFRRLSGMQKDTLVAGLSEFPKPRIVILIKNGNAEVDGLLKDFQEVFKRLEWPVEGPVYDMVPSGARGIGVAVKSQNEHPQSIEVFILSLRKMGFSVDAGQDSTLEANNARFVIASK